MYLLGCVKYNLSGSLPYYSMPSSDIVKALKLLKADVNIEAMNKFMTSLDAAALKLIAYNGFADRIWQAREGASIVCLVGCQRTHRLAMAILSGC